MKNFGKKALLAVMATSIVATSVVGLTGCDKNKNKDSAKNVFSMAAVSGASYLQSLNGSAVSSVERPEGMTEAKEQALTEYFVMFEDMLSNDGFKTDTTAPNADEKAQYGDYKSKIAVTIGNDTYAIYYNETTSDDKDVSPDEEVEEETKLNGVLVVGEDKFDVEGKREVDPEDDEVEIEFTTKNENGSVTVKQEIEEGEVSYGYEIKDNKGNKYEYEIEWEKEDGKNKMEVEITNKADGVKSEVEYEIEEIEKDNYKVSVKEKANKNKVKNKFTVKKEADGYRFIYGEGNDVLVTPQK